MKALLIALGALTGIACELFLANGIVVAMMWRGGIVIAWITSIVIGLLFALPAGLLASIGISILYGRKVNPHADRADRKQAAVKLSLSMVASVLVCFALDYALLKRYSVSPTYNSLRTNFKARRSQFVKLGQNYTSNYGAPLIDGDDDSIDVSALDTVATRVSVDESNRLWINCWEFSDGGYVYLPEPPISVVSLLDDSSLPTKQDRYFEPLGDNWYLWYEPDPDEADPISDQALTENYRSHRAQFNELIKFVEAHPVLMFDDLSLSNLENSKSGGGLLSSLEERYANLARRTGDIVDVTSDESKRHPQFLCQVTNESLKGYTYLTKTPFPIVSNLDRLEKSGQGGTFYKPLGDNWYLILRAGDARD